MNPNDLGRVIHSARARQGLYLAYACFALIVGATVAAWSVDPAGLPKWLEAAQSVVAYLAIPFGGLAAVNTARTPRREDRRQPVSE